MLFIIMLEMYISPWEFKQVHQRGNSGFQTARITLHWCELYASHLSNAKFLEPLSFLLCFSSIIICLSCFHVMPEKNLYIEATNVLHLLLTRRAISLCPLVSQQHPSCLLRAQHAMHWGLLIYSGESYKYTISFFKNRTFNKRCSGLLNQAQLEDCQISM